MNRFLDLHGVLDGEYEKAARSNARLAEILLPQREPSELAGDLLVVVDSSQTAPGAPGSGTQTEGQSPGRENPAATLWPERQARITGSMDGIGSTPEQYARPPGGVGGRACS